MFRYRKLSYQAAVQIAQQLVEREKWQALRDFLNDFYGPDTYIVDIEVAHEKYGDRVQNVLVWTREHRHVLPNLELPAWKDLLAEDEKVFDPGDTEEGRLGSIGAYMVQQNVYLDYGVDPVEEEGLRIEADLPARAPELYVLEVDASGTSPSGPGEGHPLPVQPPPAFLAAIGTAMQQMDQLAEQVLQLATQVDRLYAETARDRSSLDQMITQARLRHLYAVQHADEAAKYLAFMLREFAAQNPSQGPR